MITAREEILRRIRVANANAGGTSAAPAPGTVASEGDSRMVSPADDALVDGVGRAGAAGLTSASPDLVGLFVERTEDYKAVVERVSAADLPGRVAAALHTSPSTPVAGALLPDGLPAAVVTAIDPTIVRADPGTAHGLDEVEAVVTTCRAAIAETGTIVLDHTDGQGRRALTLVPDLHVCIVRTDQIHPDVPSTVAALRPSVEAGHPLTWISGPSATSDIELDRVEGVHGPRRLHVIVVDE